MHRLLVAIISCTMMISCLGGGSSNETSCKVRVPYFLDAEGYPAHVHLRWADNVGSTYDIYRV